MFEDVPAVFVLSSKEVSGPCLGSVSGVTIPANLAHLRRQGRFDEENHDSDMNLKCSVSSELFKSVKNSAHYGAEGLQVAGVGLFG